jgi:outer membrane cobalamin receptor
LEEILSMEVQSVFGASKFLQKTTEAPSAVTIVTAQEITRYGWRTLADVLRSVRGVYVTDDRSWAYVGVRGFQRPGDYNTRILLLVDGIRANDNVYDQALFQEDFVLDLSDVERIEVIRGPSSSLYGSSAFFGVVNVVTRSAAQYERPVLSTSVGTLGLRSVRMSAGGSRPNGVAWSVSGTGHAMHGVDVLYFPELDSPVSNNGLAVGLDYNRRRNLQARLDYKGWVARAGYNRRLRGFPSGAYGTAFNASTAAVNDQNVLVSVGWDGNVGAGWHGNVRTDFRDYRYAGTYPYDLGGDGAIQNNVDIGRGTWMTTEARGSRTLGGHRVTAGLEHRRNFDVTLLNYFDVDAPDLDLTRRSGTLGLYLQDEWRVHRTLLLSAGLRRDEYYGFTDPIKPRVAAVYQPRSTTALKLLYGEAFRAPNVYELHFFQAQTYKANPFLEPEEIRTGEAVLEHYVGTRLRVSGSLFRYAASQLIDQTFDSSDGLNYYANLASARASGFEGEAEAKWPGGVQARLAYTYARVRDDERNVMTNSPAHLVQGLFSLPLHGGAWLGVDVRAMSSRTTAVGPRVGDAAGSRLSYSFTLSNVLNTRYADPLSTDFVQASMPQNGRTAHALFTWAF